MLSEVSVEIKNPELKSLKNNQLQLIYYIYISA